MTPIEKQTIETFHHMWNTWDNPNDTYELAKHIFPCDYRGEIEIKDNRKGEMYFVQ